MPYLAINFIVTIYLTHGAIGIDPVAQSEAEIGFVKMHKRKIESKWTMDSTNCLAMQLLLHTHLLYK